jgi:hypothetical protein
MPTTAWARVFPFVCEEILLMVLGLPVQQMKFKCLSHPQDFSSNHIIEQLDSFASIVLCFDRLSIECPQTFSMPGSALLLPSLLVHVRILQLISAIVLRDSGFQIQLIMCSFCCSKQWTWTNLVTTLFLFHCFDESLTSQRCIVSVFVFSFFCCIYVWTVTSTARVQSQRRFHFPFNNHTKQCMVEHAI